MSRQWDGPQVASWTIGELNKRRGVDSNLGSAKCLQLSSMFRVFDDPAGATWIADSVRELLSRGSPSMFSVLEVELLGLDTYPILVQAFWALQEKKEILMAGPPGISTDFNSIGSMHCSESEHSLCKTVFKDFWRNNVARAVFSPFPDDRISLSVAGWDKINVMSWNLAERREDEDNMSHRLSSTQTTSSSRTKSQKKTIASYCRLFFMNKAKEAFTDIPELIVQTAITTITEQYKNDTFDLYHGTS